MSAQVSVMIAPVLLLPCHLRPDAPGGAPVREGRWLRRGAAAALLVAAAHGAAPARATPPEPASRPLAAAPQVEPGAPRDGKDEKQARIERAMALHDAARELYQKGQYRAAIAKLEEAVALDPQGKELVYNLAVIHEKLGEIERAELYYQRYLEMETDPKARADVQSVLKRLEGARRELAAREPDQPRPAPASPVAPGSAPAPAPAAEPAATRPLRPAVLAAGGVAAGALIVANVFAVSALVRDPGADARTGPDVSADDLLADAKAAHRDAVIADVALIVTGLAGSLALYFYLTTPPARRATTVTPAPALPAPQRPFSRQVQRGVALGVSPFGAGARLRVQF